MTSYTKALFERNPGAAKQLRRHQLHTLRYGKDVTLATFTIDEGVKRMEANQRQCMQGQPSPAGIGRAPFGKRIPTGLNACAANCGHPACRQGCTLIGSRQS